MEAGEVGGNRRKIFNYTFTSFDRTKNFELPPGATHLINWAVTWHGEKETYLAKKMVW